MTWNEFLEYQKRPLGLDDMFEETEIECPVCGVKLMKNLQNSFNGGANSRMEHLYWCRNCDWEDVG